MTVSQNRKLEEGKFLTKQMILDFLSFRHFIFQTFVPKKTKKHKIHKLS